MDNGRRNNGLTIFLIGIIVVLIGVIAYGGSEWSDAKREREELNRWLDEEKGRREAIRRERDALVDSLGVISELADRRTAEANVFRDLYLRSVENDGKRLDQDFVDRRSLSDVELDRDFRKLFGLDTSKTDIRIR